MSFSVKMTLLQNLFKLDKCHLIHKEAFQVAKVLISEDKRNAICLALYAQYYQLCYFGLSFDKVMKIAILFMKFL